MASVFAHSSMPGAGPFINGFLHPLTEPLHALLLVAGGLALTISLPLRLREVAIAGAIGMIVGLPLGLVVPAPSGLGIAVGVLTVLVALLVVTQSRIPLAGLATVIGLAVFLIGWDSAPESGGGGLAITVPLVGTAVALELIIINVACYAAMLPDREWSRIGIRVVASWIAAASLMVLALSLR